MTNTVYTPSEIELPIIKLRDSLQNLVEKTAGSSDGSIILSEAMASFKKFFQELSDPEFVPEELRTGDVPSSEIYNKNLRSIYNDLSRFYTDLENLKTVGLKAYNYSQVVINEIKKRAEYLSSIVLDLNILNNLTRGDVIVAGDDFFNLDNVDQSAGLSSPAAELIAGGSGLSLARVTTQVVSQDPRTKIEILPLSPGGVGGDGTPTAGNFRRFYEGCYYNLIGLARPEGGRFNVRYTMTVQEQERGPVQGGTGPIGNEGPGRTATQSNVPGAAAGNASAGSAVETDPPPGQIGPTARGIFLDYGATEDEKKRIRTRMLDGNPETFWECEYLIQLPSPLINDFETRIVYEDENQVETPRPRGAIRGLAAIGAPGSGDSQSVVGANIQIDPNDLTNLAQAQDTVDLIIDIILTFPEETSVNLVALNPILFEKSAYVEVLDIATASSTENQFKTVDGWSELRFPKNLTPEANEYLTDTQLVALMAPNRSNYLGQGVFPFPVRVANKIKVRLKMSQPVAQVYERTYVYMKNTVTITTTTTTTTTRGLFR